MTVWHKLVLFSVAMILILISITWWMSYQPMIIIVKNEMDEDLNLSIVMYNIENIEVFNKSYYLIGNDTISIDNVTNIAANYYINVTTNTLSVKSRIKYGKYFEVIEIIITNGEIKIINERV